MIITLIKYSGVICGLECTAFHCIIAVFQRQLKQACQQQCALSFLKSWDVSMFVCACAC